MPTRTQRRDAEIAIRETPTPGFVPGTETLWPNRATKRLMARRARHTARMKIARMMRNA